MLALIGRVQSQRATIPSHAFWTVALRDIGGFFKRTFDDKIVRQIELSPAGVIVAKTRSAPSRAGLGAGVGLIARVGDGHSHIAAVKTPPKVQRKPLAGTTGQRMASCAAGQVRSRPRRARPAQCDARSRYARSLQEPPSFHFPTLRTLRLKKPRCRKGDEVAAVLQVKGRRLSPAA